MTFRKYVLAYIAMLATFLVLDFIWLGLIATQLYQQGIGHLMAPTPNWIAAALFYLLFPVGLMVFAVAPAVGNRRSVLLRAAGIGLLAYGTYDLTNLATLQGWPVGLSLIDMIWGVVVSMVSSAMGALIIRKVT